MLSGRYYTNRLLCKATGVHPRRKTLIIGTSRKGMMMAQYLDGKVGILLMDFASLSQLKNFSYHNLPKEICCSKDGK